MKKIKIISFIIIFMLLFLWFSWFLRPLPGSVSIIYYEPPNTIDVLFVGSSHIHTGINPSIIWQNEGIPSYNYSSAGQPLWNSYHFIIEALKTQNPSVVVLDIYYVFRNVENGYRSNEADKYATFRWSLNKLAMIWSGVDPESRFRYIFDIFSFHSRWKSITEDSSPYSKRVYMEQSNLKYKGYYPLFNVQDVSADYNVMGYPLTDEEGELNEKKRDYLQRIIDLSKSRGFELILVKTPSQLSFDNEEEQKAYNTVRKIAEENDIKFFDYNEKQHRDLMGFDFASDMRDADHTNIYGAAKISAYMASYLKSEYGLADRRGDDRYSSWDDIASAYFLYEASEKDKEDVNSEVAIEN